VSAEVSKNVQNPTAVKKCLKRSASGYLILIFDCIRKRFSIGT